MASSTVRRRAARVTTGAAGIVLLTLMAMPAAAVVRGPGAVQRIGGLPSSPAGGPGQPVDRYNTGATHSPQVLRQLAGGAAAGRRAAPRSPIPGALQGVDVASYQHPNHAGINWTQVARAGIQFAAIKATEGAYYHNPYAPNDLANAKAAGLSVMAYAFAIPNGDGASPSPVVQANYLIKYLTATARTVPTIMLDIEYDPYVNTDHTNECYGLSRSAMVTWIAKFDAQVQARAGQDPIIYAPIPWWQTCTGGAATFRHVPLWVPDYSSGSSPAVPNGWRNWAFWQYTSAGTVPGIQTPGNTDLDQLNPGRVSLLDPGHRRGVVGRSVELRIKPADPVAGLRLSFSASGLPRGTRISARGLITGKPTTAGTYHPMVRARDGHGHSGTIVFGWTIRAK